MKITVEKNNVLKAYNDNGAEVYIGYGAKIGDNYEYAAGDFDSVPEDYDLLTRPGEYEFGSGFELVNVEGKKENTGVADLHKVSIDGVHTLFQLGSVEKLDKMALESLGEVNVLVYDASADISGQDKLMKKLEPRMIVVFNYDKAQVEKDLGMGMDEESKTIRFKSSEFKDEDAGKNLIGLQG